MNPRDHLVLYGYRGSRAHNMETVETDDVDTMGVCIPPLSYYFGLDKFEVKDYGINDAGEDIVVYEYRFFVNLLLKGNPNVLCFLWNDPSMFLSCDGAGAQLLLNKGLFSCKTPVYNATKGYALSQLKKMYNPSVDAYKQSQRRASFNKYGYDTKNAAHLIRLLVMGIEFLQTGEMETYRHDAERFLKVKRGEYSLANLESKATGLLMDLEDAYAESKLPDLPDYATINEKTTEWLNEHFG